jgi:hypothetical protein
VQEVAGGGGGLTVETTFYIADDERAGIIDFIGYYTGNPTASHYVELWVYNFDASSWEQLQEIFVPGGGSTPMEYTHEYREEHIDRSNNNEVRVRLIHNVATYNATHNLYIDKLTVSGLIVDTVSNAMLSLQISTSTLALSNSINTSSSTLSTQISTSTTQILTNINTSSNTIVNAVYSSSGTSISSSTIANSVWDALTQDHKVLGSFGAKLKKLFGSFGF